MTTVNAEECKAAGLDLKEVKRIAEGISRYGRQASSIGLQVFGGGGGSGTLRFTDDLSKGQLICAEIDGDYSGGDGAEIEDESGLMRGEY